MDQTRARTDIAALVERYRALTAAQRRLTEQETRLSFILPLFRALGWDAENPAEVSAEEQISRGFVDFGFYLNGAPAFYLETKKLGSDTDKTEHLRQAINYAYLRGVTWAVLSNFERLVVLNAEWEERDPTKAIVINVPYTDYANGGFDRLWLLSRPAMQTRALDKWAEGDARKARRQPVTTVLFRDLTRWRRELFNDMRAYSPPLFSADARAVDNAVQRLLDRLIFIRTMEDRAVEPQRLLLPLLRRHMNTAGRVTGDPYPDLLRLFRDLDAVYNSNLFAENTLDQLAVHDAGLIHDVIDGLYRAKSVYAVYDFNAISADVLGAVYEQYLSFRANDPEARQQVDIAKRARRKQQGIYYTPQFVVRYIVRQTLGRLLDDPAMTVERARRLRVLDPACGSGSFLIEAFDVLDRWLAAKDPAADARARRLAILRDNLYGVDLDDQAVEVTRLNLLLRGAQERGLLPKLTHIAHGNSLVDDKAVDADAFDWAARFPDAHAAGGFDVVVGNPPYVRPETLSALFKDYASVHYTTSSTTPVDLYVTFIERALHLLNDSGRMGYIVPNKWLRSGYGLDLRRHIRPHIEQVIDFGELPVFKDVGTFPSIIVMSKPPETAADVQASKIRSLDFALLETVVEQSAYTVRRQLLDDGGWSLAPASQQTLLDKLRAAGQPLAEYVDGKIYYGIKTGLNEAFVIDGPTRERLIRADARSAELIKPFMAGRDIKRYTTPTAKQYILFVRRGTDINQYPAVLAHLEQYRERLTPKPAGWKGGKWPGRKAGSYEWYEIQDTIDYFTEFEKPKIVYPDIAKESRMTLDTQGVYFGNTVYFIPTDSLYLLAILNSRLIFNYFKEKATVLGDADKGGRLRFFTQDVLQIPIPPPPDAAQHDALVALVERMLDLKRQHAAASALFSERRHDLAQQIADTDAAIDARVGALYGLTDAEMALVQGQALTPPPPAT